MKILPNYNLSTYNLRYNNRALQTNPSFCGIIKDPSLDYNNNHESILNAIKNKLRTESPELDGMTAEDYYKENYGIDFMIKPIKDKSVRLYAQIGLRKIPGDKEGCYTYTNQFLVGEYNNVSDFKISDIKTAQKKDTINTILSIIRIGLTAAAVCFAMHFFNKNREPIKEMTKPLIENVDSAVSNATSKAYNLFN